MTKRTDVTEPAAAAASNATLFALLWSYAMIVDTLAILKTTNAFTLSLACLVIVSAVGVLAKPSALWRQVVFALLAAMQVLDRMPNTPNHWMATCTLNLTIVAAGLWVLFRERAAPAPSASAYAHFVPSMRIQFALVYLIAALHKTNWDYLDPATSCATNMAGNAAALFGMPRELGAGYPSIIGSLLMEYGIPVLLLIPRTRLLGVSLGLMFHFILGFDSILGVVAFSADIFALYALFLPAEWAAAILRLDWLPERRTGRIALALGVVAGTALLTVIASGPRPHEVSHALLTSARLPTAVTWNAVVVRTMWHAFALLSIFAHVTLLRRRFSGFFAPQLVLARSSLQRALQISVPALVLLGGLAPYVGFKTVSCFSMFSNLRTEGGVTNHVFLGSGRLLPLDADLVEILDSSSPSLRQIGEDHVRIAYFEFRRLGTPWSQLYRSVKPDENNAPDFWVQYRRHGQVKRISRADNPHAEEFQAPPWILNKALAFRPVLPQGQRQRCVW
jgi:hypothetical protein